MAKIENPTFIQGLFFNQIPTFGKVDGYYGFVCKNGAIKEIRNSEVKSALDMFCHVDFIFINS